MLVLILSCPIFQADIWGALNLSKILKTACCFIPTLQFFKTTLGFFRAASKQPLKLHLLKTEPLTLRHPEKTVAQKTVALYFI